MKPTRLKAVLFDLDGTLVDTAAEFVVVVQQLRAEHDLPPMDPQRISASVSNGARALVRLGLDLPYEAPEFENKRQRLLALYSEVLGTAAAPYPGIPALLTELQARGIAWGVATNKPRAYAEPLLRALGLLGAATSGGNYDPCHSLVCPDDVKDRKPHPESLYRNCREIGCAPHEAVYVGDHLRDVDAGKRAGMYTVAAAYGYIEPDDDPTAWGADALANCSTELTALLLDH
jgi:phosphoglycolate phosphatase